MTFLGRCKEWFNVQHKWKVSRQRSHNSMNFGKDKTKKLKEKMQQHYYTCLTSSDWTSLPTQDSNNFFLESPFLSFIFYNWLNIKSTLEKSSSLFQKYLKVIREVKSERGVYKRSSKMKLFSSNTLHSFIRLTDTWESILMSSLLHHYISKISHCVYLSFRCLNNYPPYYSLFSTKLKGATLNFWEE